MLPNKQKSVSPVKAEVSNGFEAAHAEWSKQGGTSAFDKYRHGSQQEFYETTYWKLVREAIFRRDSYLCLRCGAAAVQVHHLNYLHRGKDHFHSENLVSVCRHCHVLLEFARVAQSRLFTFRYRQRCIQGHLAENPKFRDETPLKSLARLLEYRVRFENLCTAYKNTKLNLDAEIKTVEPDSTDILNTAREVTSRSDAQTILDSWELADKEKSERILEMITDDIKKCGDFISEALGPIPNLANSPNGQENADEAEDSTPKLAFFENDSIGKCPLCGARVFDAGMNYACEKQMWVQKSCTFRVGKKILQRTIEPLQITKLTTDGKTDLLEGFTSIKTKRKFNAFLVLKGNTVSFEFPPGEGKNV